MKNFKDILKDTLNFFLLVIGGILILGSWVGLDFSSWIPSLIPGTGFQERFDNLIWWFGVFLKIVITAIICVFCFVVVWKRQSPKGLSYEGLAQEVFKLHGETLKIELIGYSLGFANPIKLRLEEKPWRDLDVTIFTMAGCVVQENFEEQKSLDHRVDVISERLREWHELDETQKIGSISNYEVGELIPFAAVVIGGERLFVSNYKWRTNKGRLNLQKVVAPQRLFFEISNVNGAYETVMAVIKTFRRHVE